MSKVHYRSATSLPLVIGQRMLILECLPQICKGYASKTWHASTVTLILLVANLTNTKWCKKPEKWLKPLHMGTCLTVLGKSYPMNTYMTGFGCFSNLCVLVLSMKVASALEGLMGALSMNGLINIFLVKYHVFISHKLIPCHNI